MLPYLTGDIIGATVAVVHHGRWQDRFKIHFCICCERGWYFYINRRDHWAGSFTLQSAVDTVLHEDSYLGCGNLLEIDDSVLANGKNFGRLTDATLRRLAGFIPMVESLTDEDKDVIVGKLFDAVKAD